MIASTMLQSKILKMKRRLSEDIWSSRIFIILVLMLLIILSFCLRTTMISSVFGRIDTEIPVYSHNIDDPAKHSFREAPNAWIKNTTPVVILTENEFYFGDVEAFSRSFIEIRNKFIVKHKDGSPDIHNLLTGMMKWEKQRSSTQKNLDNQEILILMPTDTIPMPIVLQVITSLKSSPLYQRIVLANGLL